MKHTKFPEAIGAKHRHWFQKNAALYLYILPIMSEIKGNTQLLFCITQKKSAASWVYTTFPHITQKIITADILLTGKDHCNSKYSKNIQFEKK